ncbi:MAG: hypothetical protein ACXVGN_01820, partial [Mycobacteriaceae bacterium]
ATRGPRTSTWSMGAGLRDCGEVELMVDTEVLLRRMGGERGHSELTPGIPQAGQLSVYSTARCRRDTDLLCGDG